MMKYGKKMPMKKGMTKAKSKSKGCKTGGATCDRKTTARRK